MNNNGPELPKYRKPTSTDTVRAYPRRTGRPDRTESIGPDDVSDLKIALGRTCDIDEFLEYIK